MPAKSRAWCRREEGWWRRWGRKGVCADTPVTVCEAMESVDGSRFHDAGPTVAKCDGGEEGAAVESEERAGIQEMPGVIEFRVPWIRVESKGGDERGDFSCQVGRGDGSGFRRGARGGEYVGDSR